MNAQEQNELKEVIREAIREEGLVTRDELQAAIAPLTTREEMLAAIAPLTAQEEMLAAIAPLAAREEMLAAFDRQAELIQQEFQRINQRISALEARVAKLEAVVSSLNSRTEQVFKRLEKSSDDIAGLHTTTKKYRAEQLTTQERLDDLETRIAKLEAAQNGRR